MKQIKIVFVEDDADDRFFITSALSEILPQSEITGFASAADLFKMLDSGKLNPSVIVTDLRMPVINGFELIEKVKSSARGKKIPVAVLSTSESEADMERAMKLGAMGYFVKPMALKGYREIFEKIIQGCDKPLLSILAWLPGWSYFLRLQSLRVYACQRQHQGDFCSGPRI